MGSGTLSAIDVAAEFGGKGKYFSKFWDILIRNYVFVFKTIGAHNIHDKTQLYLNTTLLSLNKTLTLTYNNVHTIIRLLPTQINAEQHACAQHVVLLISYIYAQAL